MHALRDVFDEAQKESEKTYFFRCSYVEIYNENVFDLLREEETVSEPLSINEDAKKEFYIRGVIEEPVCSAEEVLALLRKGEQNRHYAQVSLQHASSRSHTIFRLVV